MPKIVQISATTTEGDQVPTLFALDDEGRMWLARITSAGRPARSWVEVDPPGKKTNNDSDSEQ